MNQEIIGYVFATFLGGILSLVLCIYALLNIKKTPGGRFYILATFFSSFFTFSYGFELLSKDLEQIKFWLRMEYLALPLIPVFILFMCLSYVGKKINRYLRIFLYVLPITTTLMQLTNDYHHLYYSSVSLRGDSLNPIVVLEGGLWFIVHSIFLYAIIAASIVVLLLEIKKVTTKFRKQILWMILGLVVPVMASVFYVAGLSPMGIDLGPVSMCIAFLFHGIALISYKMFDLAPIAREQVFESIDEGVLVVNQNNILVDYNQAVLHVIPSLNSASVGRNLIDILGENSNLVPILEKEAETDYHFIQGEESSYYHVKFLPVKSKDDAQMGLIITFTDVTKRVLLEQQLMKLASLDGLTQIYNRAFFTEVSEALLLKDQSVSLIMFDIDHFKRVNDTYGHPTGDAVLCHVVQTVKRCLRETDVLGRLVERNS